MKNKIHKTRKLAMIALDSKPLACVAWKEGNVTKCAINWNGKIHSETVTTVDINRFELA